MDGSSSIATHWPSRSVARYFHPCYGQEILDFLRRRRLDPSELPAFRARTAKLAEPWKPLRH